VLDILGARDGQVDPNEVRDANWFGAVGLNLGAQFGARLHVYTFIPISISFFKISMSDSDTEISNFRNWQ
jgi:hypothetical protein